MAATVARNIPPVFGFVHPAQTRIACGLLVIFFPYLPACVTYISLCSGSSVVSKSPVGRPMERSDYAPMSTRSVSCRAKDHLDNVRVTT
ncbi:hypothetical protein F4820DRAFT_48831 [Hypoxylon rubiginosum]|uniref:Uncharacterized protein n=1 Tax=Hypoxylon rubiginosum TaxID=110542 RepID=A0ACB9YQT2_9PEZI|nr:hypothetical protein F4820DRAFT_48831 [Hypoxylon rubiginosum]